MRYGIALAAIPTLALVWTAWPAPPPPPIAPKPVLTEGIRAQRQDAGTFAQRWRVVSELPPALQIQEVRIVDRRAAAGATVSPPLRPPRTVKRAALRGDICARHGLRKVEYRKGRWTGWRCRRT